MPTLYANLISMHILDRTLQEILDHASRSNHVDCERALLDVFEYADAAPYKAQDVSTSHIS